MILLCFWFFAESPDIQSSLGSGSGHFDVLLSGIVSLATVLLTQVIAPLAKSWLGLGHDYKTEELKAALSLRQDWQREVERMRQTNAELETRIDELEKRTNEQDRTIYHQEQDLKDLREINTRLASLLKKHNIAAD